MSRKQDRFLHSIACLVFLLPVITIVRAQDKKVESPNCRPLILRKSVERELNRGENHCYTVKLGQGQIMRLNAQEKGADIIIKVLKSSDKEPVALADFGNSFERETLTFFVERKGDYTVSIESANLSLGGVYTLTAEIKQAATALEKERIEAERLLGEGLAKGDKVSAAGLCKAITNCEKSLLFWEKSGDKYWEGFTRYSLGRAYLISGNMDKGSKYLNEALFIFTQVRDKEGQAVTLVFIGAISAMKGDIELTLEKLNRALSLFGEAGNRVREVATLMGLGGINERLGDNQKALDYYEKALAVLLDIKGDDSEIITLLTFIARIHSHLGNWEKALGYFRQVFTRLGGSDDAPDKVLPLIKTGDNGLKAVILTAIGGFYVDSGNNEKALEYFNQALPIIREAGNKQGEATTLGVIGRTNFVLHRNSAALENLNQALLIFKQVQDAPGEAATLRNIMHVWESLDNPQMAIFYGKQSVNKYQEFRQAIQRLDKETQKNYLGTIIDTYRKLADILIAEGRLVEAEQVLLMLKEEEVFNYLRRDASEIDKLSRRADLTKKEIEALKRFKEIIDKIALIGAEFGKLQELKRQNISLTAEQEARLDKLAVELDDANTAFQVFLRQLSEEFAKRTGTEKDLQENLALQSDMKKWGEDIVFLYTLVGQERYRIIIITPDTQTDGKTEIKAVDLNKKIIDFRAALQDTQSDPRPLGKELYDILIKPIEKQLDGAKAKTLLWSLDDNLRLLPLAALWDGNQYFGQKYQNVTVTLGSRTRLGNVKSRDRWRVLGLGVSEGKTVKAPDGKTSTFFEPLFAVREELASIVKAAPAEKGVLPGRRLLNTEFTKVRLKKELPGYKVIHIASHFSLNAGDAAQSFLLLGNGEALTVDEIKTGSQYSFTGVELLTLSACQTAVIQKDSTGREIEGFGYVAQQKGAESILATLWNVNDESTQIFMSEFYRLLKENPDLTKAEAIRLVQKALLEGDFQPSGETRKKRSKVAGTGKNKISLTAFKYDDDKPFAHPYFWSPFVLIGNWK